MLALLSEFYNNMFLAASEQYSRNVVNKMRK